jgi:hypothetical protein
MSHKLNEADRVTSAECEAALAAYGNAFPSADRDWLHPALVGTRQINQVIAESIERGQPLTVAEVEARLGPLSWKW